jgi:hypothetical protein
MKLRPHTHTHAYDNNIYIYIEQCSFSPLFFFSIKEAHLPSYTSRSQPVIPILFHNSTYRLYEQFLGPAHSVKLVWILLLKLFNFFHKDVRRKQKEKKNVEVTTTIWYNLYICSDITHILWGKYMYYVNMHIYLSAEVINIHDPQRNMSM